MIYAYNPATNRTIHVVRTHQLHRISSLHTVFVCFLFGFRFFFICRFIVVVAQIVPSYQRCATGVVCFLLAPSRLK